MLPLASLKRNMTLVVPTGNKVSAVASSVDALMTA